MTKLKIGLSGLLAVQFLLAGVLLWSGYHGGQSDESVALFDPNTVTVDKIEISDGNDNITIAKVNDQWQLPGNDDLPASGVKATSVVDSVANLDFVWPVSTSTSSHKRFEVEDDNFQREVKIYAGDNLLATFYVGTSPGFRKVHIRKDGEDEVYSVNLNSFDLPATLGEWLDKNLLDVENVDKITGADFSVTKKDDVWGLEAMVSLGEPEVPTLNPDKVSQLATAFSNFSVQGTAESAPNKEAVIFEVTSAESEFQFEFFQQEESYFVKRNDIDRVFTLGKYDFERMATVNREAIVVKAEAEADTPGLEIRTQVTSESEDVSNLLEEVIAQ